MSQEETLPAPLRVVVLAGGDSAERAVSLDSGRSVAAALGSRGHQVALVDPSVVPLNDLPRDVDVILPMLHGTGAEDGTLQDQLDVIGVPWVGSSASASRLTFDKIATRETLRRAGLPVARGAAIARDMPADVVRVIAQGIGYPLVVKPARQGSSVGVSIVRDPAALQPAVEEALRWDRDALIEEFVPGREITVPVIDGRVFPVVEILPARGWYDYDAKYSDDRTGYRVHPTGLPADLCEAVRRAVEVCGVTAISRTDLRVTESGRCCILEINSIPGMTSHSLVPMSARALGLSLGELCEQVIRRRLALNPSTMLKRAAA